MLNLLSQLAWAFRLKCRPKMFKKVDFVVKNHEEMRDDLTRALGVNPTNPCLWHQVDMKLFEHELREIKSGETVELLFFRPFFSLGQYRHWLCDEDLEGCYPALGLTPVNGALILAFNAANPEFAVTTPNVSIRNGYKAVVNKSHAFTMDSTGTGSAWDYGWWCVGVRRR